MASYSGPSGSSIGPTTDLVVKSLTTTTGNISTANQVTALSMVTGNIDISGNLQHTGVRVGVFGKDPGDTQTAAIAAIGAALAPSVTNVGPYGTSSLAEFNALITRLNDLRTAVNGILNSLNTTNGIGVVAG